MTSFTRPRRAKLARPGPSRPASCLYSVALEPIISPQNLRVARSSRIRGAPEAVFTPRITDILPNPDTQAS